MNLTLVLVAILAWVALICRAIRANIFNEWLREFSPTLYEFCQERVFVGWHVLVCVATTIVAITARFPA
jgi:hypothetical protein